MRGTGTLLLLPMWPPLTLREWPQNPWPVTKAWTLHQASSNANPAKRGGVPHYFLLLDKVKSRLPTSCSLTVQGSGGLINTWQGSNSCSPLEILCDQPSGRVGAPPCTWRGWKSQLSTKPLLQWVDHCFSCVVIG